MENTEYTRCDFCLADNLELHCVGDYWSCTPCREKLEQEIEFQLMMIDYQEEE